MDNKLIASSRFKQLVFKLDDWCWRGIVKGLDALAMGLFYVAPSIAGAGCLVLIYQCVFWLRHGTWEPITVYDAVYGFLPAPFIDWLLHPTTWLGLYKIVGYALFCSLWWVLLVLGVFVAYPLFYSAVIISDAASTLSHQTEEDAAANVTSKT